QVERLSDYPTIRSYDRSTAGQGLTAKAGTRHLEQLSDCWFTRAERSRPRQRLLHWRPPEGMRRRENIDCARGSTPISFFAIPSLGSGHLAFAYDEDTQRFNRGLTVERLTSLSVVIRGVNSRRQRQSRIFRGHRAARGSLR